MIERRQQLMEMLECMDEQGFIDLKGIMELREQDESFMNRYAFKITMDFIINEIDAILGVREK